jgi:uncharacterized OB-fold protein
VSPVPIAPNVFVTEPELRLLGGRHRHTHKIVFPLPSTGDYDRIELPPRGVLWSFTMQRFPPKSPPYRRAEPFTPFAVGYVELPGALIVEGPLTDVTFEDLRLGLPMQLTTVDCGREAGEIVQTYAFRPSTTPGRAP